MSEATVGNAKSALRRKGIKARLIDCGIVLFAIGLVHFALYHNDIAGYRGFINNVDLSSIELPKIEDIRNVTISSETHGLDGFLDPVTLKPGFYRFTRSGLTFTEISAKTSSGCPYMNLAFTEIERYAISKPCTIWFTIKNQKDGDEWSIRFEIEPEGD